MSKIPRRCWDLVVRLSLVIAVLTSAAASAAAQSATGSIEGVISDQSGAVLPGVTVTVTQSQTGLSRSAVTDDQGIFRVPLLPVGAYEVNAELSGFTPRKETGVRLTIGQTLNLSIQLALASVSEIVQVQSTTPVIETSKSQVSSTVSEVSVQNLPVNGRNFIDFALLTPGVTKDVRTGDISFAGQRGTLNSLVVDGADNNNTFFGQSLGRTGSGRAPYQFSQDAVQEFQVNSNAYSAEYGRAGGAVINVVTKSGTNAVHGSGFWFVRDKKMNANDAINVLRNLPKSPYHFDQFGGTIGGPLRRDKDFFFFNYDGQRNTTPNTVFLNVPANAPTDPASLAAIDRLRPLAESWERRQDQDVFLIKTDHQLASAHRVTVRYNHQNFTGQNFENGGANMSEQHTGNSNVYTRTFNASMTSVLGSRLFNEVRFQTARDREPGFANSDLPEANIRSGGTLVLTIGRNSFSPRETTIKRWQVADTLTWARGAHKLKGGFDFQFDDILNFFPGNFGGSYTFNSLASFNAGTPNLVAGEQYVQAFEGPGTTGPTTNPNLQEYSFFAQDEWRLRPDLTLNLGVRYDVMKTAKPETRNPDPDLAAADIDTSRLEADTNNLGPRIGLAWSPGGKKYVVRGGYGIFYGRTPSIMLGTAHSNNGINILTYTFTGASVPTYPNRFSSIPTGGAAQRPSILVVDKDFQNPRLQQASAGFDYELMSNTSLSVSYLFVKGDSLPRSIDRNLGPLGSATFTVAGSNEALSYHRFGAANLRPFANFNRVIVFEATAESLYNGVTFEVNRRFSSGLQARVAYTLGRVEDTVPDATAVVPGSTGDDLKYASNPVDFDADRTDGANDQRHRFVLSGVYNTSLLAEGKDGFARALVNGWTFGVIFSAGSGQPYTARVGAFDLNNDGNPRNDIAPGTVRNEFRLPKQVTFDPRIARDIALGRQAKVQLIWEAFNLFNADNFSSVGSDLYSVNATTNVLTPTTNFGQPLSSSGPRIMQVAAKFSF
jgi:outer membrane receptor protein involved in Fe transport